MEIVGALEPTHVLGTIGSFPLQNHGTILKCTDEEGPAVITALPSPAPLYGTFSAVNVVLRNLDIRAHRRRQHRHRKHYPRPSLCRGAPCVAVCQGVVLPERQ